MAKDKELPIRKIVRMNLRGRRIQLELRQADVAAAVSVATPYISKLEGNRDDDTPSLEMLAKLAKALKTNPEDLLIPGRFPAPPDEDLRTHRVGWSKE